MACSEENFKGWARPQRRDSQPEQGSASQRKGRLQVAPNALLSAWPAHGSSRAAKRELARRLVELIAERYAASARERSGRVVAVQAR